MQIPSEPDNLVDAGWAQRRLTLQLYSRMVTDLMVLTGGKRVPDDDEINNELRRASRAYGVWTPELEAAWRDRTNSTRPGLQFASYDLPDGVAPDSFAPERLTSDATHDRVGDPSFKQIRIEPEASARFAEA